MHYLLLLLVFPLAWPFVAKRIFGHEITFGELGINLAVGCLVVTIGFFGGRYITAADTELLNGEVHRKESHQVSCEHSYTCNCRESCSGSGTSRSCTTTCDTCYEHLYDIDHTLYTTVGDIDIRREDRQGLIVPERFKRAQIGDPVAQTHWHLNYIKAAPESLFNKGAGQDALERYRADIPAYPADVYDYHYVNRVLPVNVAVPDVGDWNMRLALALRKLGPSKQVNAIIVMTKHDSMYAEALEAAWLGGKKNDVVLVLGTPEYPKIDWARVISWTDNHTFKVELRDATTAMKEASAPAVVDMLEQHIARAFERKSMKDFEYLKTLIEPPTWLLVLLFVVSVIVSVGLSFYLARDGVSGAPRRFRRFR
ncbi:hypothetical protein LMG26857_03510 [Achromobacter anxifer]|uniref:hypothetical protein n=1 Tax=Achromobacter anxifer TaxID=1287737 RepID=UPI00155CA216|nr:hypothetical protein [Achromobacter anxifer]CAB5514451.1 hypothetical protein LMG26857_03510 [Achromobacter anxifer]